MKFTTVFEKNLIAYNQGVRNIINQGSTRSGKTYAIMQLLFLIALNRKGVLISVVAESLPHLKRGAIRELEKVVMSEKNISWSDNYNKSEFIFTINNSTIEFFSIDNEDKVRGAGRHILFVNESNRIRFEAYQQLAQRTEEQIFLDYNPVSLFWANFEIIDRDKEHIFIHSTYKDNNFLPDALVKEIESNKIYENWWRIYGLGLVGFSENILFQRGNMRMFDIKNIDIQKADNIIAFIDTADRGKDYFSMPIGAIFGKEIYIIDVIFNQNILGVNEKLAIEMLRRYNVDFCLVETNKEGSYFINNLKSEIKSTKILSIFNTAKKEARILAKADYINDRFIFRNDYEKLREYKPYFYNLTSYNQIEKNEHDDAPDSTAGLAKFCTNYLKLY